MKGRHQGGIRARTFRPVLLATALLLACRARSQTAPAGRACVPLDQYGEVLLAGSRRLHADTSAAYTEARARSHRPVLPPERIRYVTDETVCQRIATVLTARAGRGEEPPRPVRVIWEDNGYLATDFPFESYQLPRTPDGGLVLNHSVGGLYRLSPAFEVLVRYGL